MKRFRLLSIALVVGLFSSVTFADDLELESGLKVGVSPGAFNVKDVTGPNKGRSLCYRCQFGGSGVVNIHARTITPELTKLVKEIDGLVGPANDRKVKNKAFVVLLTDDPDSAKPELEKMAMKNGIKNTPLTIFDGVAGPRGYKIAKEAEVTVMIWNKQKVKVNHAFKSGKLDKNAIAKIVAEAKEALN